MEFDDSLKNVEPSEDVDMDPKSVELQSSTPMDITLHIPHISIDNTANPSSSSARAAAEDPCTRMELMDDSSNASGDEDDVDSNSKAKSPETKTKIRIVESDQTGQLRSRIACQQHTHSKRKDAYKVHLRHQTARYDQLLLYAQKQQEAYTQQLIDVHQQLVQSNDEWNRKLVMQQSDFTERERRFAAETEARLLEIRESSEHKAKEQQRVVDALKNEINELKALSIEKNDAIANLTTRLTQKKLASNIDKTPIEEMNPLDRREQSPLYPTSLHRAAMERRQNMNSSRRPGRTILQSILPVTSCGSNQHDGFNDIDTLTREGTPVTQSAPTQSAPMQSAPAIENIPTMQSAQLTAEALLNGFKDIISQMQHFSVTLPQSNEGNKSVGRRKTKAKQKLEREKEQAKEQRQDYLRICRETTQEAFYIEQDEDIIIHVPPSPEEIRSVREGETQVDASRLLLDMIEKVQSGWNCQVMEILCGRIKAEAALEKLLPCSEAYIAQLVQDRITRLRYIWRKARPKIDETGFSETAEELEDRLLQTKEKTGKSMRHLTRRTTKYERRKRIVTNTILFKQEAGDSDVALWQWLQRVLNTLTVVVY